jgi:hypothetical protein
MKEKSDRKKLVKKEGKPKERLYDREKKITGKN